MQAAVTGRSDEGTFEKARPMEENTDKAAMWRASSRAPTTRPKLGAAGLAVCLFICFVCSWLHVSLPKPIALPQAPDLRPLCGRSRSHNVELLTDICKARARQWLNRAGEGLEPFRVEEAVQRDKAVAIRRGCEDRREMVPSLPQREKLHAIFLNYSLPISPSHRYDGTGCQLA